MNREALGLPRAVSKSAIALEKSRWFANAAPRATYAIHIPPVQLQSTMICLQRCLLVATLHTCGDSSKPVFSMSRDQIPQLLCCAMEAESLWTIGYFTDPCWQRASATMMQGIDSTV